MLGVQAEGVQSLSGFQKYGNVSNGQYQAGATQSSKTSGGDIVSIGGQNKNLAGQMVEYSMTASVRETFQASYQASNGQAQVSAYYQQTKEVNVQMSFKMEQSENIAKAQVDAMNAPFGPDAVAQRITDFALSFFPMFKADHPEMSDKEAIDAFEKMVKGAVADGFNEAMGMLGALPDNVSDQLNETKSLITEKFDAFFAYLRGEGTVAGKEAADKGVWQDFVSEFFNSQTDKQEQAA